MYPVVLILLTGFITLIAIVVFGIVVSINASRARIVNLIATRNGGSVQRLNNAQTAFFKRNGVAFRVAAVKRKGRSHLMVSAKLPSHNFRLKIFEELLEPKLKRFLGMQDIEIGSPGFDETYIIQSNSVEELLRILDPAAQAAIQRLGTKVELNILRGLFTCHVPVRNENTSNVVVEKVLDAYFAILERFRYPDDVVELDLEFVEPESVVCMVCGEDIIDYRVDCKACKTPHHKDCWVYLGMCSTYGCGKTEYVQPGKSSGGVFKIT